MTCNHHPCQFTVPINSASLPLRPRDRGRIIPAWVILCLPLSVVDSGLWS